MLLAYAAEGQPAGPRKMALRGLASLADDESNREPMWPACRYGGRSRTTTAWGLFVAAIRTMALPIMPCSTYPRALLLAAADDLSHDMRRQALWGLVNLSSSGNADANHEAMWRVRLTPPPQLPSHTQHNLSPHPLTPSPPHPLTTHTLPSNPQPLPQDAHGARRVMLRYAAAKASEDQEARMLAVWTLSNLALRDASRQAMWEDADTRNTLLECTAEGEPQILRVQALRALNSLAANKANRASMQSALWQARTHCTMHTPRTPPNRAPRSPHMHRLLTTVPSTAIHRAVGYCGR